MTATEDKRFCIVRCAKLKTRGNLAASIEHNFRTRPTPNADPLRTPLNRTVGGATKASILEHLDVALHVANETRQRLQGRKTQKGAVQALEYFISASPEWLAKQTPAGVDAFFEDCRRWLVERHGRENVLSTTVQFDESSPHMCAYVVPIVQAGPLAGTLSAAQFMDGRRKLSELQTEFWKRVGVPHGLERGLEGSTAKHDRVRRHNALLNQAIEDLPPLPQPARAPTRAERVREAIGLPTEHREEVKRVEAARRTRAKVGQDNYAAAIAKGKQLDVERRRHAEREAQLREASFARDIPLDQVMRKLGCTQLVARDKQNWETPAGRISIGRGDKGSKFTNQDTGFGSGGAIDLVMHVEGFDYNGAKRWLLDSFGGAALVGQLVADAKRDVERLEAQPRPPEEPPAPAPARWPRVRAYLVDVRRLAARLVDALHDLGRIYADARSNAVFELTSTNGDVIGAELRGTGDGTWRGVRGKKGVFDLAAAGDDRRVAFVESSIEVISLRDLGFEGRIIGFAGSASELHAIYAGELVAAGYEVLAAFNADKQGDAMASVLQAAVPAVKRLRPASPKDWNDELKARARAATPAPASADQQDPPAEEDAAGHEPPARPG